MQKIKNRQRTKIKEEIKKRIPHLLHNWKSASHMDRDIEKYTEQVKGEVFKILDDN